MIIFSFETIAIIALFVCLAWLVILLLSDADVPLILRSKFGKQPASLCGKVVWVTGASSGIGEAIAYCLADAGCRLVLSARREDELNRVKKTCLASAKCKLQEDDIMVLPLDVTDFDSHEKKVQVVLEYFNTVDILINNAGKSQRASWNEVELSVDKEMFEINTLGPVSLTHALLPHMIGRKQGQIAVVSSLAGKTGAPLSRSYTGCKHAVQGYFDSLRTEMSTNNIDVTVICPGPVFSDFLLHAATGKKGEVVGKPVSKKEKRMTAERCAYLTCVAIANRQYEAWVTQQPILLLVYLAQHFPDLNKWIMAKMGVKQIMTMYRHKERQFQQRRPTLNLCFDPQVHPTLSRYIRLLLFPSLKRELTGIRFGNENEDSLRA
ncbi:dehydrogenase/reductase SDR family member [Elysia marginata]|uniref:Dehydrogenase/reductase SDR family member n=1 Tax=Elysia marginata TaxID=1093978 RepID=A0AAV4F8I8_9GAST|nr:dehydrogenase/reductase SDR family member [Elysia marginata]